jgi:hypothetical protein
MKSQCSGRKTFRRVQVVLASAMTFVICGCAHLATVRTTQARIPAIAADNPHLGETTKCLVRAEREQPLVSLGDNLTAAKLSLSILEQRPNDLSAQRIYNFSVARAVENIERAQIQPWRHEIGIVGPGSRYTLSTTEPTDPDHDPSRYNLFPTDTLKIGGTFFKVRSEVSGIGAPLVAIGRAENPQFRQQYKLQRIYAPVTASVIAMVRRRAKGSRRRAAH